MQERRTTTDETVVKYIEHVMIAVLALIVVVFIVTAAAGAQDVPGEPIIKDEPGKTESKVPDLDSGVRLARTLCAACHLIGEPANTKSVAADVPSFPSIANRPDQSTEKLSNWMMDPHPPMPNVHLTRMEIRDLAGYILSLRTVK